MDVARRGPSQGTALALPHVPATDFDFNPADGDIVTIRDLTTAQVPGGYDAVRARAFDDLAHRVTGPTGTIIVEGPYSPLL